MLHWGRQCNDGGGAVVTLRNGRTRCERAFDSGEEEQPDEADRRHNVQFSRLTVKLRGRAPTPARRRGRTLSFVARGAKQEAPHGPLQRLLEGGPTTQERNGKKPPRKPPGTPE